MSEAVRQVTTTLPGLRAQQIGALRRIVAAYLDLWQMTGLTEAAAASVTELLTNVVRHASGECELLMRELEDGLLVVVTDFSPEPVLFPLATQDAERGRGMALVHALTDEMGVEYTPVGKQVWFRLARSSGPLV
ncbi:MULTISPECIES: ATP-binding protein [Streptomyces]|uniref:ATP-binding protein n=1 Tax=Streptomyces scabiei TaxID=1930 RepID=UPI001B330FF4|nr:ATP-binding protein [Streptomyces sp. LBUM 1487]MBP5888773.1 ATP-binding protein [Streptomyces sp. LBUM 1487]